MHIADCPVRADAEVLVSTRFRRGQMLRRCGQAQIIAFWQLYPSAMRRHSPPPLTGWRAVGTKALLHFNHFSLRADNWRDSVNCSKLKVLSNYPDSHRRVEVSLPLWSDTDDEMASNYRNQTPNEGAGSRGPPAPPHQSEVCGCRGTCFIIIAQLLFRGCDQHVSWLPSLETKESGQECITGDGVAGCYCCYVELLQKLMTFGFIAKS